MALQALAILFTNTEVILHQLKGNSLWQRFRLLQRTTALFWEEKGIKHFVLKPTLLELGRNLHTPPPVVLWPEGEFPGLKVYAHSLQNR